MQNSCGGGEVKTEGGTTSKWSVIPAKAIVPATGKGMAVHISPLPCQHAHKDSAGCYPWGCQGVGERLRKETPRRDGSSCVGPSRPH